LVHPNQGVSELVIDLRYYVEHFIWTILFQQGFYDITRLVYLIGSKNS
jgi:hypothetical protein